MMKRVCGLYANRVRGKNAEPESSTGTATDTTLYASESSRLCVYGGRNSCVANSARTVNAEMPQCSSGGEMFKFPCHVYPGGLQLGQTVRCGVK